MTSDNRLNNSLTFNPNPFNNIKLNNDNSNNPQFTNALANVLNNPFLIKNLTDSILLNINNRGINLNNNTNICSTNNSIKKM